ncbi:MAG: TVP38/TMEM64 family protein, partial [Clostridium sp.]
MENTATKKKSWIGKGIIILLFLASILSYIFIPAVKSLVNEILVMFSSGDFTVVRSFVESYGAYAALV